MSILLEDILGVEEIEGERWTLKRRAADRVLGGLERRLGESISLFPRDQLWSAQAAGWGRFPTDEEEALCWEVIHRELIEAPASWKRVRGFRDAKRGRR